MRLNILFFCGSLLLLFTPFTSVQAAIGQNCTADLTYNIPNNADWRTVHVLKADDGSYWQRAVINKPESKLLISENKLYKISGFAAPEAELVIFFSMPGKEVSARVQKPSRGTCFDAGRSDEYGFFRYSAHSRMLWQGMGKDIMIDAFYKLDKHAAADYEARFADAGSYYATSYMLPRLVRVGLDPASSLLQEEITVLGYHPQAAPSYTPMPDPNAITTIVSEPFRDIDGSCPILCDSVPIYESVVLRPWEITSKLLGNNLFVSGGNKVSVGRAMNTYYVGIQGESGILKKDTDDIALKSLSMERIKRMHGIDVFTTAKQIEDMVESGSRLIHAKNLLLGIGDRASEALALRRASSVPWGGPLEEIFPPYASTPATWAKDFLKLIQFWTGGLHENSCLILDNSQAHLYFKDGTEVGLSDNVSSSAELCDFVQTNGITPTLLLHSKDAVVLEPDFRQTRIVAAEKEFNADEAFILPAGKKQPLAYRYEFTADFTPERAGGMCVQKRRLPLLISAIQIAYGLTSAESIVLAQELNGEISKISDKSFLRLSLANPRDISKRFRWLNSGESLDLLQLFFEIDVSACHNEQLVPPRIKIPIERDGFEVGIL